MSRRSNRPKRPRHKRSLRRRILIITEDTVSVPGYFDEIRIQEHLSEQNVRVVPGDGSDPVRVVKTAVRVLHDEGPFDRVFVVIDRDTHDRFSQAEEMLRQFNTDALRGTRRVRKWTPPAVPPSRDRFELILSTPCFEFWLLLHFIYRRAAFTASGSNSVCGAVIRLLRQPDRLPDYEKGAQGMWGRTKDRYEATGKPNAIRAQADAVRTGRANPSTNAYEVIDEILALGKAAWAG